MNKRLIDANALRKTIVAWAATADNSASFVDSVEGFAYDEVLDAIDAAPTIAPETLRPVVKIAWKKRMENSVSYKQISASELLYNGEYVYTKIVKEVESDIPFCPECHTLIDCVGKAKFCSFCGAKLEVTRHD